MVKNIEKKKTVTISHPRRFVAGRGERVKSRSRSAE